MLLGAFSGATAGADAARTRALADRAGLTDAYAERRGEGVAVLWGEFASPGSPESKAALDRARRATVGGEQPFSASMLVPPPKQVEGELSPWDLRTVRREFEARNEGRRLKPSLSTLMIGFYGPTDSREPSAKERADARAAAEDAVKKLRAEGEEAYFFHGPRGSSVTIGLFENDRVDPSVAADLRKKYPHKLVNGAGLKVSVRTSATQKVERLEPSQLVEVPR
ncbi:MAG: hypothetical protein HRU70_07935 [Phycisphaeraceae bacterium]|nr:MAG: hypothetical protein HRU70_07935 [Phycisphaeraceae bacterium]